MNSIVESLRGEAGQVAMAIGEGELMKAAGVKTMIAAMRKHVFPQARAEAEEFYKMGHKTHGELSRQMS